ncbi:MAG TPA: hypothetical protein DIC34_18060 [Treponema sp.]|nr:MAG: hypothetical protein A2001_07635 [Treponema sp. GWC1_61_84]HCM28406.1 hypothetical protein [Treponema sp.]
MTNPNPENALLIVTAVLAFSASLSAILSLYLFERRFSSRSAGWMALLMLDCAAWSTLNAFENIANGLTVKLIIANLQYLPIAAIPVVWYGLGSSLRKEELSETGRNPSPAIWLLPAATFLLVWLDPWLGLVRHSFRLQERTGFAVLAKSFGPWFWLHSAYSYFWILAGTFLILRCLRTGKSTSRTQLALLIAGTVLPVAANLLYILGLFPIPDFDPTPLAFSVTGLLLAINLSRFRFLTLIGAAQAAAIDRLHDAVLVFDGREKLVYANSAARNSFGIGAADLGKKTDELDLPTGTGDQSRGDRLYESRAARILRDHRDMGQVLTLIDVTRRVGAERALIAANRDLEGKIAERTRELEESALKLSEELEHRTRSERQLYHDALHDPLTGLANRNLVLSRIEQAILHSRRDASFAYGVLYLDFDAFKNVNDNYGHETGDAFLRDVSLRFKHCVRETDTVARIGGDEFVILLESVGSPTYVGEIVDRIVDELSVPLNFGHNAVVPSASIGVLNGRPDYSRPEECLRDADIAMYTAKVAGKNRSVVFAEDMRLQYTTQNRLLGDLRLALSSGGITLAFQPIVHMDGKPAGCEVLARWRHPEFGPIGPDRFIPLAESSGLIVPLGTLVLLETLKTAAALVEAGFIKIRDRKSDFFFSVNVSAIQLSQPDFMELILSSIDRLSLPRSMIHLEITETAIMENREMIIAVVEQLAAAGVPFKIDDFGTGYSSLGYLHRIPIESVKIDRSFIERTGVSGGTASASDGLVRGIISLAHELGKTVVAEGIETAAQADLLRSYGCDYGQGYFFSKPLSEAMLTLSFNPDVAKDRT